MTGFFLLSACYKRGCYGSFVFMALVVQLWVISVFEIKKMFLQINKYINTACLGDVALIFSNSLKKRVMFALSLSLNIETPAKSTINLVWHEKEFGK